MPVVPRRTLLAGFGAAAVSAVPGVAQAKPTHKPHRPDRAHASTFSDGVGLRDYRLTVGASTPPPAGSGYPDASNSGVPAGTSLTLNNSDFNTSSNGQVVNQLDIRGTLNVNHLNVTVTKCKISQFVFWGVGCDIDAISSTQSLTMSDSTIDGGVNPGTGVVNSNFTLLRCDLKGSENCFDVGHNVTIQDCFMHDLYNGGGDPHADCIQINNGGYNINISHNTMLSRGADGSDTTSCIISPQAASLPHDWVINDNVMAGGAYSLYGPQNGTATNITITNNKFWTLWFTGKSGAFGSWADADDEATVSGNELGAFSGGYDVTNKLISGTWSGTAL